jgi:hypothetical protein
MRQSMPFSLPRILMKFLVNFMHASGRTLTTGWAWLLVGCGVLVTVLPATTVNPPEFPRLVNGSDYVVRAVVKSVRAELTVLPNGRKIYTYVELDVQEVIAGSPPSPLVLRLLGGKVGEDEMLLQGAPKFQVGDESILFVKGNGRMAFPLLGIMHGHYPIRKEAGTNRKYVSRNDGTPLLSTAEVSRPMITGEVSSQQLPAREAQALTPDQFAQQIKGVSKHPPSQRE